MMISDQPCAPCMLDKPVPDFELPSTDGDFRLSDLRGKPLVIFFYPKDNTPGCTLESQQFRDLYPQFKSAGWEVVGVSRDNMKSHHGFRAKFELPFALLSDTDEKACELFGVMKVKNMYGKKVRGIERSTFVLDRDGVLRREWRGVKVPEHAAEVLQFVKTLT